MSFPWVVLLRCQARRSLMTYTHNTSGRPAQPTIHPLMEGERGPVPPQADKNSRLRLVGAGFLRGGISSRRATRRPAPPAFSVTSPWSHFAEDHWQIFCPQQCRFFSRLCATTGGTI